MRVPVLPALTWLLCWLHAAGSGSVASAQVTKRSAGRRSRSSFLRAGAAREALEHTHNVFTCEIRIGGDPGTSMTALVDTGSGNIVAPSSACVSPGCQGHHRFRAEDDDDGHFVGSATADIKLRYGSGYLAGSGFQSRICIGEGACGRSNFVMAASESEDFAKFPFDAILGLGPLGQAAGDDFNIVDSLTKQGVLPYASFALQLRASGNSSLTFGVNVSNTSGQELSWFPADARHGEWAVPLADFAVDGSRLQACGEKGCCPQGCKAVVDSGTAGIAVPKRVHQMLAAKLKVSDCTDLGSLPTLGVVLGDRTFGISPQHYVEISKVDASHCRLLVRPIDDGETTRTVILGQPFLLGRTALFDQAAMRIGLSDAAPVEAAPAEAAPPEGGEPAAPL